MKSGSQSNGKKTKKADRMELQLKEQVTRALASLRLKQAVVVSTYIPPSSSDCFTWFCLASTSQAMKYGG
jgi:hypothetical protein